MPPLAATYPPCKTTGNSPNKTIFAKNRWRGGTEPVYYFHSNHLGSASWITNNTGLPVQHLLYLPFGEHFANEHSSGYDERFTFTGKERDAETGYYYHGARFNSSDIGWLSVDPMADKYPEITPYHYCAWNPIKLVDIRGLDTTYYNLNGNRLFTRVGGEDKNMMIVTDAKQLSYEQFSNDKYHSFDVATINFDDWDDMYNYSEINNIEYGYSVQSNGTRTEISSGTYDKVSIPFDENFLYDVHVHCKDKNYSSEYSASNTTPSDIDKKGIGNKFGIILGYKYIQMDLSGGVSYGDRNSKRNSIRTKKVIGFYNENGRLSNNIDYETFKKNVKRLQR